VTVPLLGVVLLSVGAPATVAGDAERSAERLPSPAAFTAVSS
jgi:hypothetical protein